jgi:hypothetical protein
VHGGQNGFQPGGGVGRGGEGEVGESGRGLREESGGWGSAAPSFTPRHHPRFESRVRTNASVDLATVASTVEGRGAHQRAPMPCASRGRAGDAPAD